MIAKKHNSESGMILAVVDDELLGKYFEEGRLQLDITSDFYRGRHVSEKELNELMSISYILNIVGRKSIDFAVKKKFIVKSKVLFISGIPHAQCVTIRHEQQF
jgi:hypothetical protein